MRLVRFIELALPIVIGFAVLALLFTKVVPLWDLVDAQLSTLIFNVSK